MSGIRAGVAVIGAGCFGSWTALELARRGHSVALADAHGPGNSRSSSGGETRIIRMSYGAARHYSAMSWRSLPKWKALGVFVPCGALFTARPGNPHFEASRKTLTDLEIPCEYLTAARLRRRFPQIQFGAGSVGLFEPESGVLMARRGVASAVTLARDHGVQYVQLEVHPRNARSAIRARTYIYACGPWLPSLFPDVLGNRIWPTRQEVYFAGTAGGDQRFLPESMPAWVDFDSGIYSVPDIESRGLKIAVDRHGPRFDPATGSRVVSPRSMRETRSLLARYFPDLAKAPFVESRVCQYENTSNGDFLIDWIDESGCVMAVGGGSGHGFKHGPAVGEYAADLVEGKSTPPEFSLASKRTRRHRAIY